MKKALALRGVGAGMLTLGLLFAGTASAQTTTNGTGIYNMDFGAQNTPTTTGTSGTVNTTTGTGTNTAGTGSTNTSTVVPTTTTTPGLPETGFGGEAAMLLSLLASSGAVALGGASLLVRAKKVA